MQDIFSSYSAGEKALISSRTIDLIAADNDGVDNDTLANQYVWPLAMFEWYTIYNATSVCSYGYDFWLRSPYTLLGYAIAGHSSGFGTVVSSVGGTYAVRPALHLNLNSVLFTSAAVGGKSGAVGALEAATTPSGAQKLTVLDSSYSNGTIKVGGDSSTAGSALKVNVSGATANKSLSAIITDSTGAIKYYGKIAETDASGNAGNVALTLPVTLDVSNVLKIFVEELNGNNKTDFASNPFAVTVDQISATPTATTATVTKSATTQATAVFTLTNSPAFADGLTWKVYSASTGATLATGVTATYDSATNMLTLTHASDIPAGTYYVSVTEAGKTESDRLALTVKNKAPSGGGSTTSYPTFPFTYNTYNWSGNANGITMKCSGEYPDFTELHIDGELLRKGTDYTVKAGSTIFTIKASYLKKLSNGDHTVTAYYTNGYAVTTLTVDKNANPKTGDESNVVLWSVLSMLAVGATLFVVRKRNVRN